MSRAIVLALTSPGICLATAAVGLAHQVEGANLHLIAELTEENLVYEVSAETSLVPPLAHIRFGSEKKPSREELSEKLTSYFAEHCPVRIDGLAVSPVLEDIQFVDLENQVHLGQVTNFVLAYFLLHYPIKMRPQTVDVTWGIFLPEDAGEIVPQTLDPSEHEPQVISGIFYTYDALEPMRFTPDEPQYIWHTPQPTLSVGAGQQLGAASEAAARGRRWTLSLAWPIASILLLAGLFLGIKRRPSWALTMILSGAAVTAAHRPLTIGLGPASERLGEREARQRFQELHQNIYRAFDYDTDDAIYDTLAQSVSGDLLDEIYSEIYKSLVLKNEGGAVCRVKKLEYLQCSPDELEPEEKGFAFQTCWRVYGLVRHWGHTHERVNEYEARYRLDEVDGQWKIAAVKVSREKRLNPKTLQAVN